MSTYQDALEEYEAEDDNGKHRLIYAYFGLSIYFSQVLEQTFSTMLYVNRIFKNKVKTNKEINEIIDTIEKQGKTMGVLINEVKQSYPLTKKLASDLDIILKKRNHLAHKNFSVEIQKCYSNLGRKEMLKYFGDFIDQAKSIDADLDKYYSKCAEKMGITEQRIDESVNKMIQEELNRENNYS
jgi:hypothetical protein